MSLVLRALRTTRAPITVGAHDLTQPDFCHAYGKPEAPTEAGGVDGHKVVSVELCSGVSAGQLVT